ncbi:hypothetical protein HA402_000468 [Bradysia odoriphaga]|nr:hypothetical protein HA402_000468 [Bradysia odoriphaga]
MTTPLAANLDIERFIQDIQDRPCIWDRNYHCNKGFMEQTWTDLSKMHKLPMVTLKAKWKGLRDNFRVEFKRIPRDEHDEMLIEPHEYQSKWVHYKSLLFLSEHMRSRAPKNESFEPHDPFSYEVHPQTSSEFDENCYRSDGLSDGLIQIPDDDDDDGQMDNSSHSFNGLNMGVLKIPNGAAAAVAEPVLNCESSRKRIRLENDISRNGYNTGGASNHQGSINADGSLDRNLDDDYHFLLSLHPYMTELSASQKLRVRMKIQKLVFKELYKEDYDEDK